MVELIKKVAAINLLDKISFGNGVLVYRADDDQEAVAVLAQGKSELEAIARKIGLEDVGIKSGSDKFLYQFSASVEKEITMAEVPKELYKLNQEIFRHIIQAQEEETPMGMIDMDNIQCWINKAAARIFELPNAAAGCNIDTKQTWFPPDLEEKKLLMRDRQEFIISHKIKTRYTNIWKKLETKYERMGNSPYFLCASVGETITIPEPRLVSA